MAVPFFVGCFPECLTGISGNKNARNGHRVHCVVWEKREERMIKHKRELDAHVVETALRFGRVSVYTWTDGGAKVGKLLVKWGKLWIVC